jgi:hypothetical protein
LSVGEGGTAALLEKTPKVASGFVEQPSRETLLLRQKLLGVMEKLTNTEIPFSHGAHFFESVVVGT